MKSTFSVRQPEPFSRGVYAVDPEPEFWASSLALSAHLRKVVAAPDYQPPRLPAVALELLQLNANASTPMAKVRDLVQSEPLIAAKVLQLAQSAMYSRGTSIRSLDDAMARLGMQNLSDLFMQAAMTMRVFRAKGYEGPMEALRKHSVACAHLSRLVCRRTGSPDEYAYMCGLLHDVGMAAGLLIFGEAKRGGTVPPYEQARQSIEVVHEETSLVLGKAWGLPLDVQVVLGHHHHFEVGGRVHPLAAAVCLADWLASEAGVPAGHEADAEAAGRAARALRLSEQDVSDLLCEAQAFTKDV
jgi:putative nucleotidyltransferase with HDIG domain